MHPSQLPILAGFLILLLVGAPTPPLAAQESRDEFRVGMSVGGTGFVGLITEYRRNDWAVELNLSTITFREIGVAVTGKHYFTDGRIRPVVGLGLWSLTAWTQDGSGSVLILRAPLAADWLITGGHAVGVEVGMNRALAVNRLDPEDDTPPNTNLVPLPGLYYRHGW